MKGVWCDGAQGLPSKFSPCPTFTLRQLQEGAFKSQPCIGPEYTSSMPHIRKATYIYICMSQCMYVCVYTLLFASPPSELPLGSCH